MEIYIKLLDEGTEAYRPVSATKMGEGVYQLEGFDIYDPEDETWEFLPGTYVTVEEKNLSGVNVLVALGKNKA